MAIVITAYASSDTAQAVLDAGTGGSSPSRSISARSSGWSQAAIDQPLVLVVDDDHEFCESLWDLLREHGYRVAHRPRRAGR